MSKQPSRQASKQGQTGQTTNKQSNNQSSKPTVPASKQTTNAAVKQNRPADKPMTRQAAKQARRQQQQMLLLNAQRRARRRRVLLVSLIAAAVVLIAAGSVFAYVKSHNSKGQTQGTPTEQVNPAYPLIDGIKCDQLEQTSYHIHAHLTIYLNGQPVSLPQGVGIASDQSCLYWLHTHDNTGVIHIEAPKKVSPTLGNFLDIWQQFSQLGFHNELASSADWTIYVDGKQVNSTFNQLVLQPHMVITIAYNSPNIKPDTSYPWQQGQ